MQTLQTSVIFSDTHSEQFIKQQKLLESCNSFTHYVVICLGTSAGFCWFTEALRLILAFINLILFCEWGSQPPQVKLEVKASLLTGDPKSNLSSSLPVTHPKWHSGVRGERQRQWEARSSDSVYPHFLLLSSRAEPQFSLLKQIQFSSVHQGRHG